MYQQSISAYQSAAAEGATVLDILLQVYARLAQDCLAAAEAVQSGNIAARCAAVDHAFLLLGHLEDWADESYGSSLQGSLHAFYQTVRSLLLQAQARPAAAAFQELSRLVLETRQAWQASARQVPSSAPGDPYASDQPAERISLVA